MILLGIVIGCLGIVSIIYRGTLLGVLIGIHLLVLGTAVVFVVSGTLSGAPVDGQIFGFFILLSGAAQVAIGYAMTVRIFYFRKNVKMDALKNLRH